MRRLVPLLLLFLPAPPSAGAESAAEVESVKIESAAAELHYAVSWLEIPFAEAEARLSRADGMFSVRGEARSAGPLAIFFNYRGFAETEGEWKSAGPVPRLHRNGGEFRGRTRAARVRWKDGGASSESEADPPPNPEKVSPVPAGALAGAVDPFSAALAAGARVGRDGVCDGTAKVWDGRRLASWTLAHLGAKNFPPDDSDGSGNGSNGRDGSNGSGGRDDSDGSGGRDGSDGSGGRDGLDGWEGATVCELHLRKLGGFWRDARHSPRLPPRVWVAEVRPGLWAPVRAEVYSRWGKVIARLESPRPPDAPPGTEVAKP